MGELYVLVLPFFLLEKERSMGNDIGAQQNYQRSVLDAINTVVQRRIDGLKLDKTVVGIIDKNIGMVAGYPLYQVKYEGGVFTATARDASESYARNTAVYVMIPQSDFSKEKFIIGRASSISAASTESASISAAINNYVKLGPNLITNNSIYGLRSYHDPIEEESDSASYKHRFRYLYDINQTAQENTDDVNVLQNLFKTYAADATNILLRADFRTNLDVVQQRSASGRYGLAVTLTFTNPNAGYGETQGEILDNLGDTIIGKAQKINTSGKIIDVTTNASTSEDAEGWVGNFDLNNISLKDWDKQLQIFFNSKDAETNVELWQSDGVGLFDCYSQYIQTVYQTFCVNNAALQSSMTDNLVAAYLNLLSDLKNANPSTLTNIKQIYNNWRATSIGDLSDVDEIIYLTSDSMLGNPFAYTQWNNQYIIPSQEYDFSRFKEIKNIIFFKDGFKEDAEQEQLWPPSDAPKNGGKGWDIFCQNIQLFLLKDLDSENQGFSLKVECAEGYDGVLKSLSPNEKTAFNAHIYRNQTEELTSNANIQYIWLKQNSQVINAKHADYYHYAGVGWKRLKNTNRFFFQTTGNENWAYKNLYKCIALYQTATETIPLSTNFIVYNDAVSTKVKLESDLGTAFTFSEGAPTITCLIEEAPLPGKTGEEVENYQEYGYSEENPLYKYQWSIADSNNSSIIFLTEAFANNTANIFKDNLISKIKMWYWDRENQKLEETRNPTKATRIQYPVSLSSSGFTVECIVQKNFSINNIPSYYDIGNDSVEISNLKMASSSSYRVVIENGDQVFQYDEYGNAPTVTKLKDPLVIKPLRAKILGPTGLEFSGENVNIEWIFNLDDTMIVPPEKLVLNPATQQEQLLKGDTCIFDIAKLYNPNAQNNQITCHANFNNIDVYTDTKFYFGKVGSNGTNGTDMVSKISYDGNDNYFVLNSQPLTLYVQKNAPIANSTDNTTATQAMFNVPDSDGDNNLKITQDITSNQDITSKQVLKVHLYQKGEEIDEANFAVGYPRWNLAGNANGATNNTGKYFILDKGNKITWDFTENDDKKHLLLQNIKSEVKLKNSDQVYYSFFSLPIIEYEKNPNLVIDKMLPMQRIAIEKVTYLNDVIYNADGRNPIFNHNQGLKLINLPKDSIIHWIARGGLNATKTEHSNIVDEYFETKPCFSIGFEKDTKKTYSELVSKRSSSFSYNNDEQIVQIIEDDINEAMIYILPNDVYDGSATNNRVEAKIYVPNENSTDWNLYATVYAPINMTLNTFGLASLNAWDGNTVTIDEDGGYIMAPQIGAGEKDANNRFTGILMGKTETYTGGGDLEEEIGLFGYANGLQSIFLDSKTGNATFGLPDVESEYDNDGNLISRKYKNTNRDSNDDYNEGRIELRPGGESKIGGWRLGRRSLYYTQSGTVKKRTIKDFIPDINTGQFKQDLLNDPYSKHHERDIAYDDSGILMYSGKNPYISIKGRPLTKKDIPENDMEYIRTDDSLELQLDPMAPTLFTIFRHNGTNWTQLENIGGEITPVIKYPEGSRTFLAGINGKGEFVANTVSSILIDNQNDVYTTQLSINSFRAFNDSFSKYSVDGVEQIKENPQHTGLRIKLGSHILGQMFIKNNGFNADIENNDHDPTLYITGGLTENNGEYARPLSLHGKRISLFAKDQDVDKKIAKITDSELSLDTDSFKINLGSNDKGFTTLRLFRNFDNNNNLMTAGNFKINAGIEDNKELSKDNFIYLEDNTIIDKRINPQILLLLKGKNNENIYIIDQSWTSIYYRQNDDGTDENNYPDNSNYYVSNESYPVCYKYNNNYYYLKADFERTYYKINNLPSNVDSETYTYLSEYYVKHNRYTKTDNTYTSVDVETDYNTNQYIAVPIKPELIDLDQNYIYVLKEKIDINHLYGIYNIDNIDKYVYLVDEKQYYKIEDNYIEKDKLTIERKIKISENQYYDDISILNSIYYCYNNENDKVYISSTIFDLIYIKEKDIINTPVLDDQGNLTYDENGNPITTDEIQERYRSYDESTDNELPLKDKYFMYDNEYISLSAIEVDSDSDKNFVEYVLINNSFYKKTDIEEIYRVNTDIEEVFEEFSEEPKFDTWYYKVKEIKDEHENIYYISNESFSYDKFIYYHSDVLINGSNYILNSNINLANSYAYKVIDDDNNQMYIKDESDEAIYYQTYIINPNAKAYEYIPIKTSNPSSNDTYININKKYFSNSLYLSINNNWFIKDENVDKDTPYLYYFNDQKELNVKKLSDSKTYYAVRDINNILWYVRTDYLDNYTDDKYIYWNSTIKKINNNPTEEETFSTLVSNKQYELYAGSYLNKITTNETNNNNARLTINNQGIDFFNSTGPISMYSANNNFNFETKSGGQIVFTNDGQTTFKGQSVLGKFVKDHIGENGEKITIDNGLSLTQDWLRLNSKKVQIDSPAQFNLISNKLGDGSNYYTENPQIVLRAGSESSIIPSTSKTSEGGASVELILNSSNNGWVNSVETKPLENRGQWPVFAVRTSYSGIGIYPDIFIDNNGTKLYREFFYIKMPQYNSMGLNIQGEVPDQHGVGLYVHQDGLFGGKITTKTGFYGDGKHIQNTCNNWNQIYPQNNGQLISDLNHPIIINIPKITIDLEGRPTFSNSIISFKYNMPYADEIYINRNSVTTIAAKLADLQDQITWLKNAGYATQKYVDDKVKTKADKTHTHKFRYDGFQFLDKDGNRQTAIKFISPNVGAIPVVIS